MAGVRYAVLIGNGSFPGDVPESEPKLPPLRCPAQDVAALQAVLQEDRHGGYVVTALIDQPHGKARRTVYDCLRKAGPDDQVLVYYSGHGKLDEGGNLYLAGSDTDPDSLDPTAVAAADIQKYVTESRARARIVILDCCFSGAVGQAFARGASKGEIADQARQAVRNLEAQGVFYLTASTDTQTAEEKEQDQCSLLTKHIIDAIESGGADSDDDGEVRFSDLCRFVQERVRGEGAQRPLSFTLKAYGDPVVALTGRPALAARREAVEQEIYELCRLKMLHGSDAAQLLTRLNQPGAAAGVLVAELHAALSDRPLFLKRVHRAIEAAPEPVGPARSSPAPPPTAATVVEEVRTEATGIRWKLNTHTTLGVAIGVVVIGGLLTVWAINPFGTPSGEVGPSASVSTIPPTSNPKGVQLLGPSQPLLSNGPTKLLVAPNSKQ